MKNKQGKGIFAILSAVLTIAIIFAGCNMYGDIPVELKSGSVNSLGTYSPAGYTPVAEEDANVDVAETTTQQESKFPFDVPSNYKNVHDYVFAIINSRNEVIGYKIAIKKNGKWNWEECEETGELITTTTQAPSATQPTTQSPNDSSNDTGNANNAGGSNNSGDSGNSGASNSNKETTTYKVTISGRKSGDNKKETTTKKQTATTTDPADGKVEQFSWEASSINNIPSDIRGEFEKRSTPDKDVQKYAKKYKGVTYVMVVAPSGKGVVINSVSSSGQLKFSLKSSGASVTVIKINQEINISYTRV